jgi:Ca2+-binding RTX toxin-like protein
MWRSIVVARLRGHVGTSRRDRRRAETLGRSRRRVAAATTLALAAGLVPTAALVAPAQAAPVGQGFHLNRADLRFILRQIQIAEHHAATATAQNPCGTLLGPGANQIPNNGNQAEELPWGLRTVDGSCNNLMPGQERFGAADQVMPRASTPQFRQAEGGDMDGPFGPAPSAPSSSYAQKTGTVYDSQPRVISNLVNDQSAGNPAARAAAGPDAEPDASGTLHIPNTAPDAGLSAPYNSMFTLFGQFFDHGLDLTNKTRDVVFMPLKSDDPLYNPAPGARTNFMVLSRTRNQPGPDGVLGTADDVQEASNQTTPYVDQNQTYTSHPSHHVFVREYALNSAGDPVSTGRLLEGDAGGMSTWTDVKEQASTLLGIALDDTDVFDAPLLATDPYGRFKPGPNGYPQLVTASGLVEGNPAAPVDATTALRTGHAFLDDIAHHAVPDIYDDHNPVTPNQPKTPDADPGTGDDRNPGTYDDEMLGAHFIAGDGRANENIGLTAVHHVFHSEHNRLSEYVKELVTTEDPEMLSEWQLAPGVWNGERIFQAARFVTEMEYQHLAFEEFARKVQPQVNVFAGYDTDIDPAIMAEFAHTVYRFGHSMLNETVDRIGSDGVRKDMDLLDAFLNPPAYTDGGAMSADEAAGSVFNGMSLQVGNEIDEFVTEALRNRLLGLPLDLATINIARGRDAGVPPLNTARREFFAETGSAALRPYASWFDFGLGLRHRASLVNFVAAYGTHPSLAGADQVVGTSDDTAVTVEDKRTAANLLVNGGAGAPANRSAFLNGTGAWASAPTGLDNVDFWVGGLAEKQAPFGGLLGSTFNHIFESQMENLQDGDRFYYLTRTAGLNMLAQLEGNSFAELVSRNTTADGLPADLFAAPALRFRLAHVGPDADGDILDDPATPYDERALLFAMPDGTIGYDGAEHVVFVGTADTNVVRSNEGDDTVRGHDGDDRVDGGSGNDQIIGGLGDDILLDSFGDDDIKGGDGDDAIHSGPGFDLLQPGRGNDFVVGGTDPKETFGAAGDDKILGGDSADIVFGAEGDDWIEGGGQADELLGDSGAPFQNDLDTPGHDVLMGQGGADEYDAEGGDDVMLAGPGVERNEGMRGFDWVTHKNDPQRADADMSFTGLLPPSLDTFRDRFDMVEALSGWRFDDVLRGDSALVGPPLPAPVDPVDPVDPNDPADDELPEAPDEPDAPEGELAFDPAEHTLHADGIARINGLAALLPAGTTSFNTGNIILGGAGNDLIEGRGGDDIIDGDRWLDVQLRVPDLSTTDPADRRLVDSMTAVQADVLAGRMDPGDITIVRTIRRAAATASADDTAVFTEARVNYDCRVDGGPIVACPRRPQAGSTVTVVHAAGTQVDGTDTVTNVENLVFADSLPPGAPTTVTAAPAHESATVAWSAPAVGSVETYTVRVNNAAGEQMFTVPAGNVRSLVVSGLVNGEQYSFQVRASNAAGDGEWSAPSGLVTPNATAPARVARPALDPADQEVTVRWTAPDSGGAEVTAYRVRVFDVTGNRTVHTVDAPATSLTVTGLTNGEQYWFSVRAVNVAGNGAFSLEASASPATEPDAPRVRRAQPRRSGAMVRWVAPVEDGGAAVSDYRIRVVDADGAQVGPLRRATAVATQWRVRGLTNGAPYRFQVAAVNGEGVGEFSRLSNVVTPGGRPSVPQVRRPRAGGRGGLVTATARWARLSAEPAVTGYKVIAFRMETRSAQARVLRRFRSGILPARRARLRMELPGGVYRFRVVAFNAFGRSPRSDLSRPTVAR